MSQSADFKLPQWAEMMWKRRENYSARGIEAPSVVNGVQVLLGGAHVVYYATVGGEYVDMRESRIRSRITNILRDAKRRNKLVVIQVHLGSRFGLKISYAESQVDYYLLQVR